MSEEIEIQNQPNMNCSIGSILFSFKNSILWIPVIVSFTSSSRVFLYELLYIGREFVDRF